MDLNILVVSQVPPWPVASGAAIRSANAVEGLSRVGSVDLFVLLNPGESVTVPPHLKVARTGGVRRPRPGFWGAKRLGWLLWGDRPSRFVWRDEGRVLGVFDEWAADGYDLAWLGGVESHVLFGPRVSSPTVVDFFDVESQKIRAELAATAGEGPRLLSRRRLGYQRLRLRARNDERMWRRLERRTALATDAVVLCSLLDRDRLGADNAHVVPNAYPQPSASVGRVEVGNPPTLLFQGNLAYAPNTDAARYLVQQIGPRLWDLIPETRIRLVGGAPPSVEALHDPPRVEVVGTVPDMTLELARADAVVVPLRYAGGTRLKILEAFAHRIPVVSTRIGAEGLEAAEGLHFLLADDPLRFAENCVKVLVDETLRAILVEGAYELFRERYEAGNAVDQIARLAAAVASLHQRDLEGTFLG
jgi:glycosyltransferase involved in cell wall biosynthesis